MPAELNDTTGPTAFPPPPQFIHKKAGGLLWEVRGPADDPALMRILESPDLAFGDRARILKTGGSSMVARASPFVVKRFNQKRPLNRIFDRFRLDRGRRNLALSAELESLGIRTPRGVAAAPRTHFGLVTRSYLVMEELPGALTLGVSLERGAPARVLEEVGEALARLHGAGWSHRDLKATNVLVDAVGKPHLVDLDGVRRRRVTPQRRAADLGRLFRDFAADRGRSGGWTEAVLEGYFRVAPRALEQGLRKDLVFARGKAP